MVHPWNQLALGLRLLEVRLGALAAAASGDPEAFSGPRDEACSLYRLALLRLREEVEAALDDVGGR